MTVLVTGAAGFIGAATARRLLERGEEVLGIDHLGAYYDAALKNARLDRLSTHAAFRFARLDLTERESVRALFARTRFDCVIHLAAQPGVRHSIEHPEDYVDSNVSGFLSVLEGCRRSEVPHLVYASSSSVYGGNSRRPYRETDSVDHPVSLYAATKKANELMAHTYSHLYGLPTTGLRFFTVYGPWGRPDMAPFLFTRAILAGETIDVFNHGRLERDFTYIDDIVEAVLRVADRAPSRDPALRDADPPPDRSWAPYRVFNIGNDRPVPLLDFIAALESALGRAAVKRMLPMQPGDVVATHADAGALRDWVGFAPATSLEDGIRRFVHWYRDYYGIPAQRGFAAS